VRYAARFVSWKLSPALVHALTETDPEFRVWPIDFGDSGYLALYRFDSRQVSILAVRHQREAGF